MKPIQHERSFTVRAGTRVGLAASFAFVFLAGEAFAQSATLPALPGDITGFFGTEFGDGFSSTLLNQLFGPLFPAPDARTGPTILSTLIGYVNLLVLAIGGILFLYNVAVGVLQSAHEGEVLGKRWSSLWAPLRVLFAAALLMPAPGLGGYNAVQAGIAWLVRGSTGMASQVWSIGAELAFSGTVPIAGASSKIDGDLFKSVFRNQLCAKLANFQFEAAGSPLRVEFLEIQSGEATELISVIDGGEEGICGTYRIPNPPEYITRLGPAASGAITRAFTGLHSDTLEILVSETDKIIDRVWPFAFGADGELPDISEDIRNSIALANARLTDGNSEVMRIVGGTESGQGAARKAISDFISGGNCGGGPGLGTLPRGGTVCFGQGWIGAGNWHMVIARLNAEVMGLLNSLPSATESNHISAERNRLNREVVAAIDSPSWATRALYGVETDRYLHTEEAMRIWSAINGAMENAAVRLSASGFELPTELLESAAPTTSAGFLGKIWKVGFSDGIETVIENVSPSSWADDPIVGIVNMGNWYLDVAATLLFGGAAVSFLSGTLALTVSFMIAAPLVAIGITQSFILPLLPFLYWVLAVIGYFLLVAEAVVASSLWALSHLRLDGEGISGEAGRKGWLMLLSLILTPTLMVIGYFAGMAIFRVAAGLFDFGMFYAMSALVNSSPIVGIFGLIASGILIVVAYLVIIERSFSLISEFPGRILNWIGAEAHLIDGGEQRQLRSMGGSAAGHIGAGVSRLGGVAKGAAAVVGRAMSRGSNPR